MIAEHLGYLISQKYCSVVLCARVSGAYTDEQFLDPLDPN